VHHVIILIANDVQAERLEISIALSIAQDLFGVSMTITVQFNDERLFRAIEIYDVRTNAMLPTKLEVMKLSRAQF